MKKTFALIFLFCCWLTQELMAQETKLVHGKYVFEVSDNDDITLKDAKLKCIALAKAKAIIKNSILLSISKLPNILRSHFSLSKLSAA